MEISAKSLRPSVNRPTTDLIIPLLDIQPFLIRSVVSLSTLAKPRLPFSKANHGDAASGYISSRLCVILNRAAIVSPIGLSLFVMLYSHVIYCNSRALSLLGLSSLMNIRQLSRISRELAETFSTISNGQEARASYCNESSRMTVSVTASGTTICGRSVKIIAFNDISREIEDNESESWTRLIRVMTHEIMNTVTPIASLSETLSGYVASHKNADEQGKGDCIPADTRIKEGLDTIASSAKGLVRFVDSYRNLTHIPAPSKNAFYLKDMVSKVFSLTEDLMASADVQCSYKELSEDIIIYADDNQIAQIVINLLKNAVQAGADRISISARIDSMECVIIDIANNGQPVSKESREDIFTPFFTTKPDGTGIGLSISRQIMRLHNGTLRLTKSDDASTVFTMVFK